VDEATQNTKLGTCIEGTAQINFNERHQYINDGGVTEQNGHLTVITSVLQNEGCGGKRSYFVTEMPHVRMSDNKENYADPQNSQSLIRDTT
jgi:hypothetical protein